MKVETLVHDIRNYDLREFWANPIVTYMHNGEPPIGQVVKFSTDEAESGWLHRIQIEFFDAHHRDLLLTKAFEISFGFRTQSSRDEDMAELLEVSLVKETDDTIQTLDSFRIPRVWELDKKKKRSLLIF